MSVTKEQARKVVLETLREVLEAADEAFKSSGYDLSPSGALKSGLLVVESRYWGT